MKEVNKDELFKLKGLFGTIIKETNVPITADEAVIKYHRGVEGGYLKVLTDNLEDPKHCLILSCLPGMVHSGFLCIVNLIYSLPQHRNQKMVDEMHAIIDDFAKAHKCEQILGSAWKYRGSRGIDSMWLGKGYEIQEVVYVKNV